MKKKTAVPRVAKAKAENPFDKFANAKKKHDVLNRRVKGEDRNVGRALAKAVSERKSKLITDFKASKKSNVFADKRFGEQDASMSLEDKMFLRFQKERMKKVRNSSQFNLSDSAEEVLTHKGQALSDKDFAAKDDDWGSDDDDDADGGAHGGLDREVVNRLHFGGGLVPSAAAAAAAAGGGTGPDGEGFRKNKLDALQEIVMKSKMHKLQKKETKLVQEQERENLDRAFQSLVGESMLEFRPVGRDRSEDQDEGGAADEYDTSLRSMAFEAKAQPTDRTKSAEEIAVETRERLEKLEAERLRRMKSSYDPDKAQADAALGRGKGKGGRDRQGKKSAKGKGDSTDDGRRVTDDEVDNTFGSRAVTKSHVGGDDLSDDDGVDEEDEDDGGEAGGDILEDEEWEDDDDEDGEEDGEEDEDEDEEIEGEGEEEEGDEDNEDGEDEEDEEDDEDEDDEDEDDEKYRGKFGRRKRKADEKLRSIQFSGDDLLMPHRLPCPQDLAGLDDLVAQYTSRVDQVTELINRIIAWNNIHLPGTVGVENKRNMQGFLEVLMKHFVRVGDTLPHCESDSMQNEVVGQLDHLSQVIFQLQQDLPDSATVVWARTLKLFQTQLQRRLREYVAAGEDPTLRASSCCWPSVGRLLLMRLLGLIFPVTDYRHVIVGPAVLLMCQCLTQCPVVSSRDLASGLLSTSILIDFISEAEKYVPEIVTFLGSVLAQYGLRSSSSDGDEVEDVSALRHRLSSDLSITIQSNLDVVQLKWLRQGLSEAVEDTETKAEITAEQKIAWSCFDRISSSHPSSSSAHSYFFTTCFLIKKLSAKFSKCDAYPEIFQPIVNALRALNHESEPRFSDAAISAYVSLSEGLVDRTSIVTLSRKPLQWRKVKVVGIQSKNPRFQVDYKLKKDVDPDETRVKLKQLTREKKREHKAAMRELRRDSSFIDQERFKDKSEALAQQRAERHKNYAWMEEQQATVNQQVRKGQTLLKGGGSGIGKKARVKR